MPNTSLIFYYFCIMNLKVSVISKREELPAMTCRNFFHSTEFFHIIAATPGHTSLMAVACDEEGRVAAHLLAIVRRRGSLMPPYLFTQGRIYGVGEYEEDIDPETTFPLLLDAITRRFRRKLCLYAEFSNLPNKMFGYRYFRQLGYFPVSWQEVHNSLHSKEPRERLSEHRQQLIDRLRKAGIVTREINNDEELQAVYDLFHRANRFTPRNFIPPMKFFSGCNVSEHVKIYATFSDEHIIGACASVSTEGNAWLWYVAAERMNRHSKRPALMTIWHAIEQANAEGLRHFYFMDAGLPFRKSKYREFILGFGGKPVAKYRWFRFSFSWLNKLLAWLYRE